MSYDIDAIRNALAAALTPLVNAGTLNSSSAYGLSNPAPPCAMVTMGATEFDEAMGGGADGLTLEVSVLIGLQSEVEAQKAMDALRGRGANSLKALLESDPTLGGIVDDLRVTKAAGDARVLLETGPALGAAWTVYALT